MARKQLILIISCIVVSTSLCLLLANCDRSDGGKVLRVSTWNRGAYILDLLEKALKDYEEQHPNISIKLEVEPWEYYWTKLQTQIMGGNAPDIMLFKESSIHSFAENGAFLDIQSMVDKDDYDLSDFYEVAIETGRWNGKLYALPIMMEVPALFYIKEAFDIAGVPYPESKSMTWEEFLELCKKLTIFDADGKVKQYAYVESSAGKGLISWIKQNGGEFAEPIVKPTECVINSPESIEAAQFYFDLSVKYQYTPTILEYRTDAMGDSFQYVRTKRCALYQAPSTSVYSFDQEVKNYGVIPLPHRKRRANTMSIDFQCINAKTKYPQEAWELMKYMVGPVQDVLAENFDSIPARKSIATTKFLSAHPDIKSVFLDELNHSEVIAMTDKYMELLMPMEPYMDRMASQKISIPQALDEISSKVNAILRDK